MTAELEAEDKSTRKFAEEVDSAPLELEALKSTVMFGVAAVITRM